jgi:hypothetical protein
MTTDIIRAQRLQWTKDKQLRRTQRERGLASAQIARGKIGVVYASYPSRTWPENIVDRNAVLFLKAPNQKLLAALSFMSERGFQYKTCFVWIGNDEVDRSDRSVIKHITFLVGTRGKIPAPAPGTQYASILSGPDAVRKMIKHYFPNMPILEVAEFEDAFGLENDQPCVALGISTCGGPR